MGQSTTPRASPTNVEALVTVGLISLPGRQGVSRSVFTSTIERKEEAKTKRTVKMDK